MTMNDNDLSFELYCRLLDLTELDDHSIFVFAEILSGQTKPTDQQLHLLKTCIQDLAKPENIHE